MTVDKYVTIRDQKHQRTGGDVQALLCLIKYEDDRA